MKVVNNYNVTINNKIRTIYEHIAIQIARSGNTDIKTKKLQGKMLLTGGGTHNNFLIDTIKRYTQHDVIIPPDDIIDFKEALIFGLLGMLRIHHKINCLVSVTGAKTNNIGGVVHHV